MVFTSFPARRDYLVYAGITLYFGITVAFSFWFEGTFDSGDSIMHYLFAKHAFRNPAYFFHHWAKPVFVLLSSPFAQFGFTGIKLFNGLVSSLTLLFTYQTVKKAGKDSAWLVVLLLTFAPLNFTITFSGLTEPLSALLLILALYLIFSNRYIAAALTLSFLPFVRSEGLIFLGVFLVYLLIKKKYRVIPWLATGHLVYALAGYFYHLDLLWVFTQIPYAHIDGRYGSGPLFHYLTQLTYVAGIPIYILVGIGTIGVVAGLCHHHFRALFKFLTEELWLVYGSFFAFLTAHTLFWYLGLFDSMGLKRVFVTVMPLMAWMGLNGFLFLRRLLDPAPAWVRSILLGGVVVYVLTFPFTGNPASIRWNREFSLTSDQILVREAAGFLMREYPDATLFHKIPYLEYLSGKGRQEIEEIFTDPLPVNSVVIWDSWFAPTEKQLSRETLLADRRFSVVRRFSNDSYELIIFRYIPR